MTFTINEEIQAPIYVYYQLDNFYQNHRRYVKSRSFDQLKGNYLVPDKLRSDCDPIVQVKDLGDHIMNINKQNPQRLDPEAPAIPCGLVAKSFFNDRYSLKLLSGEKIDINEKGIAWESDKEYKFANINKNLPEGKTYEDVQWLDMTDGNILTKT